MNKRRDDIKSREKIEFEGREGVGGWGGLLREKKERVNKDRAKIKKLSKVYIRM